ncbi:MAG: hypothetical protein RL090_1915 [Bacteroidota bacterium]|jgi:hypothetical protein
MSLENKSLELSGKVIQILPMESGEGRTGQQWKKQYFVIEYMDGNYPKKVSIMLWGDKTDALKSIQIGSDVKVSFNVESREYNGRWYTDIKAWRVESLGNSSAAAAPMAAAESTGSFQPADTGTENDLPF